MKYTSDQLIKMLNLTALTHQAGVEYTYYQDCDGTYVLGGYRKVRGKPALQDTYFKKEEELKRYIISLINFWQRQGVAY